MEIVVAKTAGFCFGVDKAVGITQKMLDTNDRNIYTLGHIIHNRQVIDKLSKKGARVVEDVSEIPVSSNVVIRAHGVSPDVYAAIEERNLNAIDATCPYVKKIHRLVDEEYKEGCQIIIVGDRLHPEVRGINGWCENKAFIVNSVHEAEELPDVDTRVCVFAQTTLTREKWESINEILKNKYTNCEKFDTICNATSSRQKEAAEIASSVDVMIVIGGKDSSNTQKLYEICSKYCENTLMIETADDLPPINIKNIKRVGITAGASTPDEIIKEVIDRMDELNKQESELSFKEAFENSLKTLRSGEVVKGKIIGYNNSEVFVDMGYKSDGVIPMGEYSDDPDFKPENNIKVGDEIDVFIVRVNDGEGNVLLSKKKVDAMKSWESIEEAFEKKLPLTAKVVDVVNGGVIASYNGIRIFVPASQLSDRFVKDLEQFLKKTVVVRLIEFNRQKRKLVGSQRVILEEEKEKLSNEIWGNIEVGKKYQGMVKSFTDFGAFVDIGGVDGLIHVSELSWKKVKHPSDVLKIGDSVEVTVLEFDKSKNRISLGYRKAEDNPWFGIEDRYKVGDVVKAKVVRLVPFGAFLQLENGVDGLVHISQISTVRLAKPGDVLSAGQEVEAKIVELDAEAKKIGLSIKEVNPINPANAAEETKPEAKDDKPAAEGAPAEPAAPTEHKEELNNTIGAILGEMDKAE